MNNIPGMGMQGMQGMGMPGMNMPGLSGVSGGLNINLSFGINIGDSFQGSAGEMQGNNANALLSSLNGLQSFPGMNSMGMVPGFGGCCNPMGSMFGGMMQQMQQQQQMLMMMMMMLMMMMQQQQNGFGRMGGAMPGMGGMGGVGGGGGGTGAGSPSGASGASGSSGANPNIAPSGSNAEALKKLKDLGMSKASLDKAKQLKPEMQIKLAQLYEFAKSKGINFEITSGLRSREQQEKLYQKALANKSANGGKMSAAKPGSSRHESGLAIDISGTEAQKKVLGEYWKSIGGTWGGDWGGPGSSTIKETWHFDLRK